MASARVFYELANVGRVRYVVNFHDGIKSHADGSAFYDIATFSNRRVKDRFVRLLIADGYRERGI